MKKCLVMIVWVMLTSMVIAEDWPHYRGPQYDGASTETDWHLWPQAGPRVLWKASLGTGFSSIVVADGRLYSMGNIDDQDIVWCRDAVTGAEHWKYPYKEPMTAQNYEGGPNASPTVVGDRVYTFSKTAKVHCLDAKTGGVIWMKDLMKEFGVKKPQWGHASSPVVLDGMVYLNAGDAGIALKASDGNLVWQNGQGPGGYASVIPYTLDGIHGLVIFGANKVFAVAAADGRILWQKDWKTSYDINAADPIVYKESVFLSSGYNYGCALLKLSNGDEVYKNKNMKNQCYGCALYQGNLYGFDGQVGGSGKLTCMDLISAKVRWQQGGLGTGTVLVAGNRLIVLSEKGRLVVAQASPDGYQELASGQVLENKCWTVPTLAHGLLYARDALGNLVCLDLRN